MTSFCSFEIFNEIILNDIGQVRLRVFVITYDVANIREILCEELYE